jgi:hypothetical protein
MPLSGRLSNVAGFYQFHSQAYYSCDPAALALIIDSHTSCLKLGHVRLDGVSA